METIRTAINLSRLTALTIAILSVSGTASLFASSLREEAMSYRAQGYEAQNRGDDAMALSFYQKAAALDPTYPTPHNDIGVLKEKEGHLEEAEQAYQQALTINPNYLEAHANLAMLYELRGQKEKATFHWLKRYQLGEAEDPWTAKAEERLLALGVLKDSPEMKGQRSSRRRAIEQELQAHEQSLEEFRAITQEHGHQP